MPIADARLRPFFPLPMLCLSNFFFMESIHILLYMFKHFDVPYGNAVAAIADIHAQGYCDPMGESMLIQKFAVQVFSEH